MSKVKTRQLLLLVCFLLFLFIRVGYSTEPVLVEFLFYEPCATCPKMQQQHEIYLNNSRLIDSIESDYKSNVSVKRIYFYSKEGLEKIQKYGIGLEDWNAIIINGERVILGSANETYVRKVVESYLYGSVYDVAIVKVTSSRAIVKIGEKINITVTVKNVGIENESFIKVNAYCNESLVGTQTITSMIPDQELSLMFVWDTTNQTQGKYSIKSEAEPVTNETSLVNNVYIDGLVEVTSSSSANLVAMLMLALSFGFFETFSPCLIILLSFLLSYTLGSTPFFKESFLKVMTFGAGFLSATLFLAIAFGLVFLSMPMLQYSLTWAVCIFAGVFGFYLLGALRIQSEKMPLQSKPLIRKLAGKYGITYVGLFLLGFIFYFLDPCIAPIFVSMLPLLSPETLFFNLLMFCVGAVIPFIGIGVFAGSVSKLARSTYRHRFKIRATSGLILIGYALYLIIFHLLK